MRISALLSAALLLAATLTLDHSADPAGSFAPAAGPLAEANPYAFFPPNRPNRVAVSWDRDLPVTYLVARRNARSHMLATIHEVFRRARVQTGLRFRYGGRAATSRPVGTADRPVVLVDFGTAAGHPRLAKYGGGVYAVGGPFLTSNGTSGEFTGGQVTIDVRTTRGVGHGFRHSELGVTLLHEVGHVLGLDHVDAPGQLMAPGRIRANISGWFHDGDLRGLRRLIQD